MGQDRNLYPRLSRLPSNPEQVFHPILSSMGITGLTTYPQELFWVDKLEFAKEMWHSDSSNSTGGGDGGAYRHRGGSLVELGNTSSGGSFEEWPVGIESGCW